MSFVYKLLRRKLLFRKASSYDNTVHFVFLKIKLAYNENSSQWCNSCIYWYPGWWSVGPGLTRWLVRRSRSTSASQSRLSVTDTASKVRISEHYSGATFDGQKWCQRPVSSVRPSVFSVPPNTLRVSHWTRKTVHPSRSHTFMFFLSCSH